MAPAPRIPSAPGPEPILGLGALPHVLSYLRDPIATSGRLFERYGRVASIVRAPFRMARPEAWPAAGQGVVVATGADHNREILTQHDRYQSAALTGGMYPDAGKATPRQRPLLRTMTGLFHVNGEEHRRHRRLLMPAFHKTRLDAYRDDMVHITGALLDRYRAGETRDVHGDMTELTLRIATKTLFGEDEGARGVALARRMQEWLLSMFSPAMMLPDLDLPGMPYRRFLDLTRDIDAETAAILRARRARRGDAPGADMLSMLIAARDEDGSALDEDELVGHTGVIFAAGHETSTNALAWTLLLLSQHPAVARDLEDELDVLRGAPPGVDDVARLPLLDAVVKESMRVLPPVPLHPRIVAEDSELGGHALPAGSEVFLSIFHMHHDPGVFSEPGHFRPRRWETIKPTVYEYNPFSAGPRMCIGASFATMEIKIVLAMLLQRWRVELPDGARVDPRVAITMAPRGGLRMTLRERGAASRPPGRVRGRVRELVRLPS